MQNVIKAFFMTLFLFVALEASSQTKWYNPEDAGIDLIQGQAFEGEERESVYHRFPSRAKGVVRDHVWGLSTSPAGESIVFTTDSRNITVKYTLWGGYEMPHMPATGVSGVDLYTSDDKGNEIWLAAKYEFRDTVRFRYADISIEDNAASHTYTMFLPLYNQIRWMEIGVDEDAQFAFEKAPAGKPVVVYGTSIAQGACASRPGMAWRNILQRMLGRDVVNLGLSGNALMEHEVIDLLADIDAEVYLIDAMPNVCIMEPEQVRDTVLSSIRRLRAKKPDVPIVLVDHHGYPHSKVDPVAREKDSKTFVMQKAAYDQLKKEGMKKLYYLSCEELAIPQDGTVEGSHPSDYGMQAYAEAYRKKLKRILK